MRSEFEKQVGGPKQIAEQMAEQFRTQTWLHAEGDGYRFRHEVFTHVLAAQYILHSLSPEGIGRIRDWNPESRDASTVVAYVRQLITPRDVVLATGCLVQGTLTAYGRALILAILRETDKSSETREGHNWLNDSNVRNALGPAIKAAIAEPEIAGPFLSCVCPWTTRSQVALEVALCFLALGKRLKEEGGPKLLPPLLMIVRELANIREPHGHVRRFEDLLEEMKESPRTDERLLKAAGLSAWDIWNPFVYEAVLNDLDQRLPENSPDVGTWRYVRHAAQYLRDYVLSKSGQRR
jgi:hypothetical protein